VSTIIRLSVVTSKTGLSRSYIYLLMSQGKFPTSISLGPRAVGWIEAEVDQWITNKIQLSRNHEHS